MFRTSRHVVAACLLVILLGVQPLLSQQRPPRKASPAPQLPALDAIVEKAIAADELPGAVVLVWHKGQVVHRRAYGSRSVLPTREPMTVDTIFDLASLTKVVATSTAIDILLEQGKIRLNDPVARYIPEFAVNGKEQVTIRHLVTHTSGLRPIPRLPDDWMGAQVVLESIYNDALVAPPGARFIYTDCGFILLAELVRRAGGMPLDEFVAKNLFEPLGMRHTRFRPPDSWVARIAPTEEIDLPQGAKAGSGKGRLLRGVVHDPRARGMGGVAGHAGLFSTADDLAIFARMLLARGRAPNGKYMLSAATVQRMTTPQTPPWSATLRGIGWDIDSVYSAPRGELFPLGSFGHTGFTGTSIWIDPSSQTFVILLANSVHPYGRPAISSLRAKVATAVAAELKIDGRQPATSPAERSVGAGRPAPRNAHTKTGLDVLVEQKFAPLAGKRVGLITNHTGIARDGTSAIDLLHKAEGVQLVALFSPEHGIAGRADDKVASGTDPATGLPIHSLYGDTRRPTDEMLRGVDVLVFDIQDAGVRFYTYITTMAYAMEEAAKRKIPFVVLDRPNPLGGEAIEGPILDRDRLSFVGYFPLPVRYGMTLGELALLFNAENKIGADLRVIAMDDWRRSDGYESTGLAWIGPSPNLRSLDAALLYPGIEIQQAGGVSVGRGTDTPFELFGAPWIRGAELADYLNRRFVPGVRFVPVRFTPREGLHKGVACEGAALVITDRWALNSMLMGMEIAAALWKLYPADFKLEKIITLVGNAATLDRLKKGDPPDRIVNDWADDLETFKKMRAKYLLYR
jgi:uncharacterized protein YbbC (DUF1343 family)/CubicO group peptidase (beta-lactamase class C family)